MVGVPNVETGVNMYEGTDSSFLSTGGLTNDAAGGGAEGRTGASGGVSTSVPPPAEVGVFCEASGGSGRRKGLKSRTHKSTPTISRSITHHSLLSWETLSQQPLPLQSSPLLDAS